MKPYSMDLRERVLAACDAGRRTAEVAATFRACPAWVRRLKQRRRESGSVAPLPRRAGRKPAPGAAARGDLAGLVAARPDATLAELRAGLGAAVSTGALWGTLRAMGPTLKKSRPGRPSNSART